MIDSNQLFRMSRLGFDAIERNSLVDLRNVSVDPSLPIARRMESYIEQIKNPYCFLCEGIPVRIEYKAGGEPLEEKILSYFVNLKNR
jgi:hypothetical protein